MQEGIFMRGAIHIAIAVILFVFAAGAQGQPDFSGTWLLDTGKSDFGDLAAPISQTNVIEHKDASIDVIQTITSENIPGGTASTRRHYSTDGKETSSGTGGTQLKFTAKWDGGRLLVHTTSETPVGRTEIDDVWELREAGGPLVITRRLKLEQGDHQQKLVFNKEK
jgi:hypothetical protein